jgi:hypothetical protein
MDKRIQKRWRREHHKPSLVDKLKNKIVQAKSSIDGMWRFHEAQWGDLRVMVLPKSDMVTMAVSDSNTGLVMSAPYHGTLLAHIVVNNGSKPDCDEPALNQCVTGDRKKSWKQASPGFEIVHCLPRRRMEEKDRNEFYWSCVDSIREGQKVTQEQAVNLADEVLGWSPDTISCSVCGLTIHGLGGKELIDQAREYGWSLLMPFKQGSWRCPADSFFPPTPLPSWEELCTLIHGLDYEL